MPEHRTYGKKILIIYFFLRKASHLELKMNQDEKRKPNYDNRQRQIIPGTCLVQPANDNPPSFPAF